MTKIKELNFSRFRNNDHFQFMTDVNTLITNATPAALNIEEAVTDFNAAFTALNNVFKVDSGSVLTAAIGGADVKRDSTWSAIYMRIRATLMGPIDLEIEAAEKLKRIFDLYGNVRQLGLTEESAALNNLVDDLEKEENATLCNVIGITRWVAALKELNAQVQSLMLERRAEAAHKLSGDVKAAREVIDPLYVKIVARLNALVELDMATPETYDFITLLNKQIKDFEEIMAARKGRRNAGEEDNDPITGEEENNPVTGEED